jgi:hypothetical protein
MISMESSDDLYDCGEVVSSPISISDVEETLAVDCCPHGFESCFEFVIRRGYTTNKKLVTWEKDSDEAMIAMRLERLILDLEGARLIQRVDTDVLYASSIDGYYSMIEGKKISLEDLEDFISRSNTTVVLLWGALTDLLDMQGRDEGMMYVM